MLPNDSPSFTVPFTAVPNVLIDEVMPTLKDTEWRLLCVIARQTLGWVEKNGKRKARDWISQSQLIARTGRNSAALSSALDVLVRGNLIECQTESGEPLLTSEQRRRHRGRVYFNLAPHRTQPAKSELQKANRTKETQNKRNPLYMEGSRIVRLSGGWKSASEVAKSRSYGFPINLTGLGNEKR